jgi:hypothetical protein
MSARSLEDGMRKIVSALVCVVAGVLLAAGCSSTTGGSTGGMLGCATVVPDGGVPQADCIVAWSCNSDVDRYLLACSVQGSNFACACYSDGAEGRTFNVNPFSCDGTSALPAANTGCGWMLTLM